MLTERAGGGTACDVTVSVRCRVGASASLRVGFTSSRCLLLRVPERGRLSLSLTEPDTAPLPIESAASRPCMQHTPAALPRIIAASSSPQPHLCAELVALRHHCCQAVTAEA